MILSITPQEAMNLLGSAQVVREDVIVPKSFPDSSHTPYQPEYDWLFQYERQIAAFLEKWLRRFRYELIGQKGILCEALSNAFSHGHRKDPFKAINLRVFLGKNGLMVEIKDDGKGFNVQDVYVSYQNKKPYFATAGNGIRLMAQSPHFGIFHHDRGRAFNMLYLFKTELSDLPDHYILIAPKGHQISSPA